MNDQERELPPPTAELREAAEAVADAIHDLAHAGGSKDMVAMTLGYLVAIAGQPQPSEDWVQRQLRNPAVAQALLDEVVRLSCVEVAAEAKPAKWHDEHTAEDVAFRFEVTAFFDSIQQRIAVAHSTSSEKAVACANYLETLEGVAFPQVREMDAVSVAPAADPKKTDWERVQSGEPWNLPRVACEETLHAGHRAPAVEPNCGNCWTCLELLPKVEGDVFDSRFCRMVLCVTCGNKRCPKANNHRNECSNSNEPGQPGSAYEAVPVAEPPSPVAARHDMREIEQLSRAQSHKLAGEPVEQQRAIVVGSTWKHQTETLGLVTKINANGIYLFAQGGAPWGEVAFRRVFTWISDPPATSEPVIGEKSGERTCAVSGCMKHPLHYGYCQFAEEIQACTECGGSGQGPDRCDGPGDVYQDKCGRCNGTGKEPV